LLLSQYSIAQKVGLVLSGGAASGTAHIGVLKALEENNIPIDYITGTSVGGLIGGLYASGYSPIEIEKLFTSDTFQKMVKGQVEDEYKYFFKKRRDNASWVTVKFSKDTVLTTSIPTSVISPVAIDFQLMELLSGSIAKANYNFDSLFIPFRCVASDVEEKKAVIFKNGHLSQAVRASMSYPFYLKPIKINGKILFDGGLYNNFPSDVMYDDFFPDIIIGSNVSYNFKSPNEDDVLSFIKNMLVNKTDYSVICENGIIIEPPTTSNTFEFRSAAAQIEIGYKATLDKMENIKEAIHHRVSSDELSNKRAQFNDKKPPLIFENVYIEGLNERQSRYVKNTIRPKKRLPMTISDVKPGYYRVYDDEKINYIYPTAAYNKNIGLYDLELLVKKEKEIIVEFGGNFSSRPINTAFIGLQYNYLGNTGISLGANSYFGKLYGSTQVKLRWDLPIKIPFFLQGEFTINRWDFFKSSATFFEEVKPSYLIKNEQFWRAFIGLPAGVNAKIQSGFSFFKQDNSYYQTQNFSQQDTTDETYFKGNTFFLSFEHGTLNKKQYANEGTKTVINFRSISGEEFEIPGSTSINPRTYNQYHQWVQLKFNYETYYKESGNFRLGLFAEGLLSNQKLFNNYTSSILQAPSFQPNPESKTLFLESFRAFQYVGLGHRFIYNIRDVLDLRLAGYVFQPYREIIQNDDNSVSLGKEFKKRYTIISSALVYHSPIGPVSLNANYYHNNPEIGIEKELPITFMIHFGYIIFNNHALD
jgi:NTE family protein